MIVLLQRRHLYARRREFRARLCAILVLLAASAIWYAVRPAVTLHLACSAVGCPGREQFLSKVLQKVNPDLTDGTGVAWSFLLRGGRVVVWRSATQQHVFDGDLHRLGSICSTGGIAPCPTGFDAEGGLTLAVPYDASLYSSRSSSVAACGIVRLRERRTEVTGVIIGPGSQAFWKDTDNDGASEIAFWKRATLGPPRFQIAASVKLDRNGMPLAGSLPDDGSVVVWTPPGGVPLPIPEGVKAEDFFQELLPLPDGFGAWPITLPTSTPSSSP